MTTFLDPEERDQRDRMVIELTKWRRSAPYIADVLSISTRTVHRVRRRHGCGQAGPQPLTDSEIQTAKALLEDGASYEDAARTLGRSSSALKRRLPGYQWSMEQIVEYAALGRQMARLKRNGLSL